MVCKIKALSSIARYIIAKYARHNIADECLKQDQHHSALSVFKVEQSILMSMQRSKQSDRVQLTETRCMDVCIISASMPESQHNTSTPVQATYPSLTVVGAINRLHQSSTEAVYDVHRRRSLTATNLVERLPRIRSTSCNLS